jgi:purine-nucleoside phosphorylase
MSIHIGAENGDVAETILLPGDPLRAKHIAEKYLKDAVCYNTVRNMFGFTGLYNGMRVSVQGTGMGGPSASIYIHELIHDFGVKQLIRIGTAGSYQPSVNIRDIVIALSASTNAAVNQTRFNGADYAPCPDFGLLQRALDIAKSKNIPVKAGNVLSSDQFYVDDPDGWKLWAAFGVLAVEMETSALYTIAAQFRVKALGLLTISDSLVTGESCSSIERETSFDQMTEIALELV